MSRVVLKCENLNKKLSRDKGIFDVSFEVYEKDILGVIGPNGAGKTTIIKLILGLYNLDSGSVSICGVDIKKDFVKAISQVGAIIENPDMYMYMSGYDNLKISAKIYNLTKDRIWEVIKLVGLEDGIYNKVSKYSLGMKQRLGIAQAIIHNPKVLILDEPLNGLDPEGIIELNQLLKKLAKSGMSIIISSHILSELESLCNRVCIVNNGKIIDCKTINELKKEVDEVNYIIELSDVKLNKFLYPYEILDNQHIRIRAKKEDISKIIRLLLSKKLCIYELKKEVLSLENVFLNTLRGDTDD